MPRSTRSSVATRLARAATLMVVGAVPLAGLAALPAHADDATKKSVNGGSTCTNDLVKSGSGSARVSGSGYSYVDADAGHVKISTTKATTSVTSCSGTSDNPVATSTLKVTMEWTITSTGLASCSFGLPSGFSCTVNSKVATIKKVYTCSDTSTCSKTSASEFNVYPRDGYKIAAAHYRQWYYAKQSGKDGVNNNTTWVTWTP